MDINKEIALLLGFKFLEDGQVIYPNNWVITSFCARIYSKRRNKTNVEKLIKELEIDNA